MITLEDALSKNEFHFGKCTYIKGARGGVKVRQIVARRNGGTKTWATRPNEFRVPVKRGLHEYAYVTHENASLWHTAENCPLNHTH